MFIKFFLIVFILIYNSSSLEAFFNSKKGKSSGSETELFITIEESSNSSITLNKKYVKYVIQVKNKLSFFIVGERSPIEFEFESSDVARQTKNTFFGVEIAGVKGRR